MPTSRRITSLALAGLLLTGLPLSNAAASGADNYKTYCSQCHGLRGDGKGVNARDMSVNPRDHTDAKAMSSRSDEQLFKVIKEGGLAIEKSVLMPPWDNTLSDEEIHGLVKYLRELCACQFGK